MKRFSYTQTRYGKALASLPLALLTFWLLCWGNSGYGQTRNPAPYCNPNHDCTFEQIDRFSLANVTNSRSCVFDGDVTYFNNLTINVNKGQSYNLEVDADNFNAIAVWVDWDKNGSFEADENIVNSAPFAGDVNTSITVPSDVLCGKTRLRVMSAEFNAISPSSACNNPGSFSDGEVQDYDIFIDKQGGNANDINVLSADVSRNSNRSAFGDLKVRLFNPGTQPIPAGDTIPIAYESTLQPYPNNANYVLQSQLGKCEATEFTLEKVVSYACPGTNKIQVTNRWGPDANAANDTARTSILDFQFKQNLLSEGFENGQTGQLPTGWTSTASGGDNGISNCGSNSGSNSLILEGDDGEYTETPEIDVSGKGPIRVEFAYIQGEGSAAPNCGEDPDNDEDVIVKYWDGSQYVTETTLVEGGAGENQWASFSFTLLQPLPSDFSIRFKLNPGGGFITGGDSWVFDDFKIKEGLLGNSRKPPQAGVIPRTAYKDAPEVFNFTGNTDKIIWNLNGNNISNTGKQYFRTFNDTGKQDFTLTRAGCYFDTVNEVIDVVEPTQKPGANFFTQKNVLCTEEPIRISNESVNGATDFKWKVTPQNVNGRQAYRYLNSDSAFRPRIEFLEAGDYNVTLIASNNLGSDTFTQNEYFSVTNCYETCNDMMSSDEKGLLFDSAGRDAFVDEEDPSSCAFTINPACTDSIVASLRELNIAGTLANGSRDNLKVYDGPTTSAPAIHNRLGYSGGFYEGNAPSSSQSFVAKSGAMTVVLNTNGNDNTEDFILEWEAKQSASQGLQQNLMNVDLNAPDTAYNTGVTTYTINNPVPDAEYEIILPGFNRSVTRDTIIPARVSGVDSGFYVVKLVSEKCGYADTATEMVYFKDVENPPRAAFTASTTTLTEGDTVKLFDLSKPGPQTHQWSFDPADPVTYVNGTDSSTINPSVVIDDAGKYRVDLIVGNKFGRSVEAKIDYLEVQSPVTVSGCTPVVGRELQDLSINQFNVYRSNGDLVYSNPSGLSDNGYGQYDATSELSLESGREYIFEIERNTAFNDFGIGAWLDLNRDGDLTQNEALFTNPMDSGFTARDTATIPKAPAGDKTLRIATNLAGNNLKGCGPHQAGEFEDYSVDFKGDIDPPTITLKGGDTVVVDVCNPSAADTGATAFDVVDGNISGRVELRNTEVLSKPGTYNLPYVVTDDAGNRASKTQTIIVTPDNVPPQISLNGQPRVSIELNENFMDPGAEASDACGEVDTILKEGSVNSGVIGNKILRYIAVDGAGNTDTVTRLINVEDPEAPTAQLLGSDTVVLDVFGTYEEPGLISSDNYRDSTLVEVKGSVNTDSVGVYELTYEVADLDTNITTLKRTVIVEDNVAPVISDVPDNAVVLPVNNPIDIPFDISDNYYEESQLQVSREGGFFEEYPTGIPDSLGTYTARFRITDGSGNTNSLAIAVEVVDQTAPTVTIDRPVVNINRFGLFNDSLGGTYDVNDNYYDRSEISIDRFGSYFSEYIDSGQRPGVYEIRYTAVDPSGNQSKTIVRSVNVREKTTGIEDNAGEMAIDIYPNPTAGPVKVDFSNLKQGPVDVTIINAKGQTVRSLNYQVTGNGDSHTLDLSDEAKGLYKVKVRAGDEVVTESVVVQ